MPSFRELLGDQGRDPRGRHRRGRRAPQAPGRRRPRRPRARRVRAGRHPRRACTSPGATSRASIESRVPDKTTPVIVHCASGVRSAFAAKTLAELGYTDVVSVAGGFNKWKDEGRDWAAPRTLTAEQRNRYQRHLLLPEVDVEGQLKLLDAKVLLLGAGGLGSPAALYLAAAGVGTHRHHRHGRRRRVEPAAPDPPQHGAHRRPQGRLGQEDAHRCSTPTSTSSPTTCASAPTT